jgi:hypothetical protein
MKWKLTTDLCGEPMIDSWDDDEDLTLGYSLLRALAEDEHTLVEIAPNVWRHSAEGVTYMSKGTDTVGT